jgi:hypothetical protein
VVVAFLPRFLVFVFVFLFFYNREFVRSRKITFKGFIMNNTDLMARIAELQGLANGKKEELKEFQWSTYRIVPADKFRPIVDGEVLNTSLSINIYEKLNANGEYEPTPKSKIALDWAHAVAVTVFGKDGYVIEKLGSNKDSHDTEPEKIVMPKFGK